MEKASKRAVLYGLVCAHFILSNDYAISICRSVTCSFEISLLCLFNMTNFAAPVHRLLN